MGDFASVIGSGSIIGLDDIPYNLNGYYKIVSANIDLDLSDHIGYNIVDGAENLNDLSVTSGSGNDYMSAGFGDDTFVGGKGADTMFGNVGDDTLSGGDGTDLMYGGTGDDTIDGGAGNDTFYGDAGADEIRGGKGADQVDGGIGDDTLYGDAGDDVLTGASGDDVIYGGDGYDTLSGGIGNDELFGGKGNDLLNGGVEDDSLVGGDGNDTFVFDSNFGEDVISDFAGGKDQIWLAANINDSGINNPLDVAQFVSGDASQTTIRIGEDSIRLDGVGKDDFLQHLTTWVKVV